MHNVYCISLKVLSNHKIDLFFNCNFVTVLKGTDKGCCAANRVVTSENTFSIISNQGPVTEDDIGYIHSKAPVGYFCEFGPFNLTSIQNQREYKTKGGEENRLQLVIGCKKC